MSEKKETKETKAKVCNMCTRNCVPYGKDHDMFACLRCDRG